jgi:hypothetical protein
MDHLLVVGGFLLSLIALGLAGGAMLVATSAQRKAYVLEQREERERGDTGGDR